MIRSHLKSGRDVIHKDQIRIRILKYRDLDDEMNVEEVKEDARRGSESDPK